jgi:hypothetical protein
VNVFLERNFRLQRFRDAALGDYGDWFMASAARVLAIAASLAI